MLTCVFLAMILYRDVPARAGPGPNDGSSKLWLYHSHVNPERDVATGLVGPIIITAANQAVSKIEQKEL
jgi:hypothetical protein